MLEKEFQYYLDNQLVLVKKYKDKFLVIKEESVIGFYDTEIEAFMETKKEHKVGTFLIQKCTEGDEGYTETFHSRVAFHE